MLVAGFQIEPGGLGRSKEGLELLGALVVQEKSSQTVLAICRIRIKFREIASVEYKKGETKSTPLWRGELFRLQRKADGLCAFYVDCSSSWSRSPARWIVGL